LQVALLASPLLGVILAWRWEQIGGAILVVCALLFWTLPPIAEGRVPMLTTGDLILLPGTLSSLCDAICAKTTAFGWRFVDRKANRQRIPVIRSKISLLILIEGSEYPP
jgi:hypothetical protein